MKYAKSEATFTENSIKIEVVGRDQSIVIWDHFNHYSKLRVIYNAQLKADFLVRALNRGIENANQVLLDDAITSDKMELVSSSISRVKKVTKCILSFIAYAAVACGIGALLMFLIGIIFNDAA